MVTQRLESATIPLGHRARTLIDILRRCVATDASTTAWCAIVGAAIVLLIAAPLSAALNIWLDEAFTLHTTGSGIGMAWSGAVKFEDQPPLYFVIEAAWRILNESSITFARLPSVVFTAAAVAVMVVSAHRIAPRTPPLLVAAMAAFHPLVLWAAVEMRVYALVLLIGAILTWTFYEGFLVASPSRNARICYAIVALAGLYTQYFVGIVLAAQFLTLIVLRRRGSAALLCLLSLVAIGFLPFSDAALTQIHSPGGSLVHATFIDAVHQVIAVVFSYALPHDYSADGALKLAELGFSVAALVALVAGGQPQAPPAPVRALLLQAGFAVVVFVAAFAVVGVPFDLERHLIVMLPPALLVFFMLLSSLRRARLTACALAGMVFAGLAATELHARYHAPLAKQGDWQRVATRLSASDATAPIAVFPAELALPLRVYLAKPTIAIPRPMPFTLDYVAATRLTRDADVARVLDPLQTRSRELWVVTENVCRPTDIPIYDYHCGILEAFLAHRYRLEKTLVFRGLIVRRYVRTSTPAGVALGTSG